MLESRQIRQIGKKETRKQPNDYFYLGKKSYIVCDFCYGLKHSSLHIELIYCDYDSWFCLLFSCDIPVMNGEIDSQSAVILQESCDPQDSPQKYQSLI